MLAAAHVLAMDSKNLLDVVDTIRMRYPQINQQLSKSNSLLPESDQNQEMSNSMEKQDLSKSATESASSSSSTAYHNSIVNNTVASPQSPPPPPMSPTPVSCTFVPMYSNNIQKPASSCSSSSLSTNNAVNQSEDSI